MQLSARLAHACARVVVNMQFNSRCGFWSVRYLEVEIHCEIVLGSGLVSAVRCSEVAASRRLLMYDIFNP